MQWETSFIFCATLYLVFAKHEQYEGYALYDVSVKNLEQATVLSQIENQFNLDVWSHSVPGHIGQVLVPKTTREYFEDVLSSKEIEFNIAVNNIKEKFDLEDRLLATASTIKRNRDNGYLPLDRIYQYDEINEYIEELASKYSQVTVANAGKSVEGRNIKYIKISSTNFNDTSKPIVMMQSLLHAREWITQSVTLYAIQKLVIDVTEQDLLNNVDWIIIPIANPDGYQYTHDLNRSWRKNRAQSYGLCAGVDLNRNFAFNWGTDSSSFSCSETFHGSQATSEPETFAIDRVIREYQDRIKLFLDIHSYGSYILYAYGNGQLPPNALILNLVGVQMAQAIDAVKWESNINYRVGNTALILYRTSGTVQDYAQAVGIPFAYTYELPAYRNSGGLNGFLVDPDFIEQAGFETWEGIKVGVRYVVANND